ncbi:endonuclease domain-containing protein [Algoriphagus machipongonensis]|uniref:DNA methylase n=1 Tax=Algoriphagus machipongonensis TaxID=388413 RepID=A3HSM4_9BACT|nr:endonuclease domain-containing protein [Algoriphagus machipongonensis]EAZ82842.1 putative DNA methylase [Algoriphagus machipongonensis]
MYFLPYNRSLKEFSRELRNHSTLSEILLWNKLKAKNFRGYSFNRQKPLGNYIVDFYCKKLGLVIEVDGDSHVHPEAVLKDNVRQKVLEDLGLEFFRIPDAEIKRQMLEVLDSLNRLIDKLEEEKGLDKTNFV